MDVMNNMNPLQILLRLSALTIATVAVLVVTGSATGWSVDEVSADGGASSVLIVGNKNQGPLRAGLLAEGIPTVDSRENIGQTVPNLAFLLNYDAVIFYTDCCLALDDRISNGDILADYVDEGGSVIMTTFAWESCGASPTCKEIGGRIQEPGYSPFEVVSNDSFGTADLGEYDEAHPIMDGITSISSLYRDTVALDSGAILVASWDDGRPFVAHNPGCNVIGITLYPGASGVWTGDALRVFANAANFGANGCPASDIESSRNSIQRAVDSVAVFLGENKHIGHAEKKIGNALEETNWVDDIHAVPKNGKKIYSSVASAVGEYEKALRDHAKGTKNTLSDQALAAIETALIDIEIAIVILTEIRMDEASGLIAIDPDKQSKVDSENEKALKEYDDAMNKLATGDIDKGIRELAKAWDHSNHAEKSALEQPKIKKGKK